MTVTADRATSELGSLLLSRYEETAERYQTQLHTAVVLRRDGRELGDIADEGTMAADVEQQDMLTASLHEQLVRMEEALRRYEDGSLGTCERCGGQIPEGRLEIMPWATHCVPCQAAADKHR
ncbi:TraR/DksA family transcriptional regulator [Hamadaea tsunoensis]|uniref:TraR/DksA family transcriptional regulator n=1 Tax=Hamadaea tsunoensis TaxID=53368 RepID=UPI00041CBF86|nr:TraR/DksA family transcriptional regulator [Hamadaea tsunoensis]